MSATAVVVVDMLNPFRHHDAEKLIPSVEEIIAPLADLIDRARHHDDGGGLSRRVLVSNR